MKISIVTVNFNGVRYLSESIDSVLTQTHKELELLIIDGGSTDGSLETIKKAAGKDTRVKWISEPDRGIADAMNKGIGLATGELIAFLHSDDRYPESKTLARVVDSMLRNPDAVWLSGGIDMINGGGKVFRSFPARDYSYRRLQRSNILFHPATFVRTEVLRERGMFDDRLKLAMDYDLWLRLGSLADPLLVKDSLACFRVHRNSVSTREADRAMNEEFAIRQRYLKENGRWVWPYACHHKLKKINNVFFMCRLRRQSQGASADA